MDLKTVKKYFHEEDKLCYRVGNHPLKSFFEKCKGAAYIKRFESGTNEIMFTCERFNDIHVTRECSHNCSNYALCRQIDKVKQAEAVLDMYYS
jgi:hypothetical protein